MPKLPKPYRFFDLSDYGGQTGRWIARSLKNSWVSPVQLTSLFVVSGAMAMVCILNGLYGMAAFLLVLKSILDAADGELARIRETPSYVGRYYDSVSDMVLNFMLLLTIWYITSGEFYLLVLAFLGMQLQGTLYNYYYVILRNQVNGDSTSRIFENASPRALAGEKQQTVDFFYRLYRMLYTPFDRVVHRMDPEAVHSEPFPKWFMTLVSFFGLGFQLLTIGILLVLRFENFILYFLIATTVLIPVFIAIRKWGLGRKALNRSSKKPYFLKK
jgi:hypothetical protein